MAELDPEKVGRSGVDPITGSVLSKEVREALVKKTTVDSSAFRSEIATLENKRSQEEVQNLRSIQGQEQALFGFNSNIQELRTDINRLGTGLSTIALLLNRDAAEERNRIQTDQENQRILTERQIRIGKESEIEKKIQNAVLQPVQKLVPKVQDIFGGIGTALGFLFGGWLTNQTVKAIQASEEGNTRLFNDIKGRILKNIGIAAGGLFAIRAGFSLITNTIRNLATGLTRLLVIKPLAAASILFNNLLGGMRGIIPGLTTPPTRTPTPPGTGGGFLSLIGKFVTGVSGVMNFLNGENIDTILTALTFVPGGGMFNLVRLGAGTIFTLDQISEFLGSNLTGADPKILKEKREELERKKRESTTAVVAPTSTNTLTTPPSTTTQSTTPPSTTVPSTPTSTPQSTPPQVTAIPQQTLTSTSTTTPSTPSAPSTQTPAMSSMGVSDTTIINQPQSQTQPEQSNITLAQISVPPQESQRVGQLPQPSPELTIIRTANSTQSQTPSATSSGPLTDVPLINSSNPDNFYVLYSQLNYNIVM